jgi:hypothetical protein
MQELWYLKPKCVQHAGRVDDVCKVYFTGFEYIMPAFISAIHRQVRHT